MTRRSYGQYCALARALDIVGERWTLLIVRELAVGPRRFTDVLDALPGIGTSLLTERLKHLESQGLARRDILPPPAASRVYELTADGRDLVRALLPLVVWGVRRLGAKDADEAFNPEWLLLALEHGAFDPEMARGVRATIDFDLEGYEFHIRVDDGAVATGVGPAPGGADAKARSDLETFTAVASGRVQIAEAAATGRATVEGDADAFLCVLRSFRVQS